MKKHRAIKEVADGLGQSSETLRDWEKQLARHEDKENDLYCSRLAGQFSELFAEKGRYSSVPSYEEYGLHRGVWNADYAKHLYGIIPEQTLEEIKNKIREYRDPSAFGAE
jgi:hypothetical protein